jgi:hypothetical protein
MWTLIVPNFQFLSKHLREDQLRASPFSLLLSLVQGLKNSFNLLIRTHFHQL